MSKKIDEIMQDLKASGAGRCHKRMNKVKFTVEISTDNYCGDCPCLGLDGHEEEHCGYFNKPLNCKGLKVIKCDECKLMTKMLIAEEEKTV